MAAAGLWEELDKVSNSPINEESKEDILKAEIDEFLADDMARAFDVADVEMPNNLSGDRYEQAMDAAREALLTYFQQNPSEISSYLFEGRLIEATDDIDKVLDILRSKGDELKGPDPEKYMDRGEYYTWKYGRFDFVIFKVFRNAQDKDKQFGVSAVQGHHLDRKVMEKYDLVEGRSWVAGVESYTYREYGKHSIMGAKGLLDICSTVSGGHSSYAKSFADYVAGGGE